MTIALYVYVLQIDRVLYQMIITKKYKNYKHVNFNISIQHGLKIISSNY